MTSTISAKSESTFMLLPQWAKGIVLEYSSYCKMHRLTRGHGINSLLFKVHQTGENSLEGLTCKLLVSSRLEDGYQNGISQFLRYLSANGKINPLLLYAYKLTYAIKLRDCDKLAKEVCCLPIIEYPISYEDGCKRLLTELKNNNYSRSICDAVSSYINAFTIFLTSYNIQYSEIVVSKFINFLTVHNNIPNAYQYERYLLLLHYVMSGHSINTAPAMNIRNSKEFPAWFLPYYDAYKMYRVKNHMRPNTLSMDRSSLLRFSFYLDHAGITSIGEITPEVIKSFYTADKHTTTEGKAAYTVRIRQFLAFLFHWQYTESDLSKVLNFTLCVQKTRPTSILTEEQYSKILNICSEWESSGALKDSLILKIALWTGLRSCDIIALSLNNIDWEKQVFKLIQKKTNIELEIPFPTQIGNLLYDYLKQQKLPISSDSPIFKTNRAPYRPIQKWYIRELLSKATGNTISNVHLLRKTFATRMLRSNTSITLVSDALGHVSNSTVDPYIDTHKDMMSLCGLSIPVYKGVLYDA